MLLSEINLRIDRDGPAGLPIITLTVYSVGGLRYEVKDAIPDDDFTDRFDWLMERLAVTVKQAMKAKERGG